MIPPSIQEFDESVADRMLSLWVYLSNSGRFSAEAVTTLVASAFQGSCNTLLLSDYSEEEPEADL